MNLSRSQTWLAARLALACVLAGCASPSASTTSAPNPTAPPTTAPNSVATAAAKPTTAAAAPSGGAAATAVPASGGQPAAQAASGEPYHIGVTFPLTGPQAAWGTLIVPVMEISVKDVNDA